MTPEKVCVSCGTAYLKKPRYSNAQWAESKCCSRVCLSVSRRTVQVRPCQTCGDDFRSRPSSKYCSVACAAEAGRTRPTVRFNGDTYTLADNGYFYHWPTLRLLHRVVWEAHNGPIPLGYEVHHRDENKTNNAIENLEALTKREHRRLHMMARSARVTDSSLNDTATASTLSDLVRSTGGRL